MMRRLLITVATLTIALPSMAARLNLAIVRHGVDAPVTLIFSKAGGAAEVVVVERAVEATQKTVELELAPGQWTLDARGDGLWHGRQYLYVVGDRSATAEVWAAGVLEGTIRSKARRAPTEIAIGFEGTAADHAAVSGVSACPVTRGGAFECRVPVGVLDLRIKAERHIGRFLWNVAIKSVPRDVGELELREGQSIVGRVELPRKSRADIQETVLRARPNGTMEASGPVLTGRTLLPQVARAEKNGLFHFDGVSPGEYIVRATHPSGLVTSEVVVLVREGASATDMLESLRLEQPKKIRLDLTPNTTPAGARWRVAIDKVTGANTVDPLSVSLASMDGTWLSPAVPPGEYRVVVGTSYDDAWHAETVALGTVDEQRSLTLSGRAIRGRVTIGSRPVHATVEFHDPGGSSVTAVAGGDGAFSLMLPDKDRTVWRVTVRSESPFVDRTIDDFPVPQDASSVVIEVPNTILTGRVVDEKSAPVANALVTVASPARLIQPPAGPDGVFEVYGLVSGAYEISASSVDREADQITVDFREDDPPSNLTLVARKRREYHGQVVSPFGPVAGATVVVRPPAPLPSVIPILLTGADGGFETSLPQAGDMVDIVAAAPGFTFFAGRVAVDDEKPIRVTQRGGALLLRTAESTAYLVHSGAAIPLDMLESQWPVRRELLAAPRAEIRAPMMDPGPYSLCAVSAQARHAFLSSGGGAGADRCVSGVLDPLGVLTLELPGE